MATAHDAGVIDLLGIIAYGALSAFERLAADAAGAPTLRDKMRLAAIAGAQVGHLERVGNRLAEREVDLLDAMRAFQPAFDDFHARTRPRDWLEGLMWVYVGNGFATDFYREVAGHVDDLTRRLVEDVTADAGQDDFVVEHVRAGIDADPRVAGRLALWGRRLLGEALSQAQRVAVDRESLAELMTGPPEQPGMDLAALGGSFARLVDQHAVRMRRLGLQP